ncbi:hypothetical protein [Alkalihalobacterium sp. APHAB7]|uniref:hypothetical protein n=1 Tax=Alkalihalobacterium sp. APHAB7 TaxID=3402081 RepID=UPI003AABCCEA
MTTDVCKRFMSVGATMGIFGAILLFFSVDIGTKLAHFWLVRQGSADPTVFHLVNEGYIHVFIIAGSILFTIGLVTVLLTSFRYMSGTLK